MYHAHRRRSWEHHYERGCNAFLPARSSPFAPCLGLAWRGAAGVCLGWLEKGPPRLEKTLWASCFVGRFGPRGPRGLAERVGHGGSSDQSGSHAEAKNLRLFLLLNANVSDTRRT